MTEAPVDRCVRALLEWLTNEPLTASETVTVLARALTFWLEAIPIEERPRALQQLWIALDDALEAIEVAYADMVSAASPPMTRQ